MPTKDQSKVPYPTLRQSILYTFQASLYRPSRIAGRTGSIFDTGSSGDIEAADGRYSAPPDYTGVRCYYEPTPEFTNTSPLGLNKEENIFTSDKFHLFSSQEISDAWLIVMTSAAVANSLIGRCWIVQGNSEIIASSPLRPVFAQWVYAKLSPTSTIPAEH